MWLALGMIWMMLQYGCQNSRERCVMQLLYWYLWRLNFLVYLLDDANTQAIWSDANINVMQECLIKEHFSSHFGQHIFLPHQAIINDSHNYYPELLWGVQALQEMSSQNPETGS
jgi:hypothetical protein